MTSFLFIFLSLAECVLVERLGSSEVKESKDEGQENEGLVMENLSVGILNKLEGTLSKMTIIGISHTMSSRAVITLMSATLYRNFHKE